MNAAVKRMARRVVQTLRLMVGVGDYEGYCEHMRQHHPGQPPMSRADYFRHCQTARYASGDGKIKRCPC